MSLVPELGHAALLVALILSIVGVGAAVRSGRSADPRWLASARNTAIAQFALVTGAALALEFLLTTSDFSVGAWRGRVLGASGRSGDAGPAEGEAMRWRSQASLMILGVAAGGCVGVPVQRAAQPLPAGGQEIRIELSGFSYRPELITVKAATPLIVTAVSDSRIPHDITIVGLDGALVKRVDVPPRQTVAFDVTLERPGRYVFYCSKFLHRRPFGMDGILVVR
jgi:plastocyanin